MRWAATSVRMANSNIMSMAQPNCNDQIAAQAFGCEWHYPPTHFEALRQYDVIFATMWKVCTRDFEPRWMDVLHQLKDRTDTKVVLFQEAETPWPTTRPWDEQKSFIELLGKVDLFLTHNQSDIDLWGAIRQDKHTIRWRTCIDIEPIKRFRIEPWDKPTKPILFGSSYDQRANGLTGLIACKNLGYPLWHQNRSNGYEDRSIELPNLLGVTIEKEIQHQGWGDWLKDIAGAYVAVHPMPAAAAGRDQIALAALGIPCIGNRELDIQGELFIETQIGCFDVRGIRATVIDLMGDTEGYMDIRQDAMTLAEMYSLPEAAAQARKIKEFLGWL